MLNYYIVKEHQSETISLRLQYFNADDQNFTMNIKKMTMFRDRKDAEAFKHVMEFYGHQGLTIREVG